MDLRIAFILLAVVSSGCGPTEKDKVLHDLYGRLAEETESKIKALDNKLMRGEEAWQDRANSKKARSAKNIGDRFFLFADKFHSQHWYTRSMEDHGHSDYPINEIISRYENTMDSLQQFFRENHHSQLKVINYSTSYGRESVHLIVTRMKYDVAENIEIVFEELVKNSAHAQMKANRSDATYTSPLNHAGHQYSFSIRNDFIQQFTEREVVIENLTRNGMAFNYTPTIDQTNIVGVFQLTSLDQGKYTILGRFADGQFRYEFEKR
jgi:hypothetical protein